MSDVAIQVQGLGKRYTIGGERKPYRTLRESITGAFRRRPGAVADRSFWALKDVNFTINRGEVVGIIGRNGAGKSTLLKVLSRITEPTEGGADIEGRVGSLLEVGTGFHPELTGRENVYLNGAILGMRRAEISRKFDEIVAFAETEKFLDTPVKFYSSGMYTRLAFAVAAHLDPEILIVDEVLAVGDAEFQRKCLGKMKDVAGQGRTVLFVSHNMNAVESLCGRCVLLRSGELSVDGVPREVISHYLASTSTASTWRRTDDTLSNPYFDVRSFELVDANLRPLARPARADERVGVVIEGDATELDPATTVGFSIVGANDVLIAWALHTDTRPEDWPAIERGRNRLVAWLPPHFLNEGDYQIQLHVSLHFQKWLVTPGENAPSLNLSLRGGLSESPHWMAVRPGLTAPIIRFEKV